MHNFCFYPLSPDSFSFSRVFSDYTRTQTDTSFFASISIAYARHSLVFRRYRLSSSRHINITHLTPSLTFPKFSFTFTKRTSDFRIELSWAGIVKYILTPQQHQHPNKQQCSVPETESSAKQSPLSFII